VKKVGAKQALACKGTIFAPSPLSPSGHTSLHCPVVRRGPAYNVQPLPRGRDRAYRQRTRPAAPKPAEGIVSGGVGFEDQ
jgi:hypothetical protein